ncbi:type II secretion system F family protein [Aestuariivirga sp.]|jgi:tight adherence protein B|uniref:type II secretion system F family protein n=1 Tax=Aestuariivirga sp. TaxID=2650926 RepID=UPI003782FD04
MMQIAVIALIALAVGSITFALLFPLLAPSVPEARVRAIGTGRRAASTPRKSAVERFVGTPRDSRRRQLQESLKQIEDGERRRKRKLTLRTLIARAGLSVSVFQYWAISALVGFAFAIVTLVLGLPWYISLLAGVVGLLGLPRWFLNFMIRRREQEFLEGLADAIDIMVRGVKAGLPLSDAIRVIATEIGPPIGPEFLEVVEGQRLGIPLEQGLERMFDRMPLPEVSFLSIVISIQSKTGGNLSEALGNLSKVLRDRKKMKSKIRAMSQEAKTSAAIIGSLPFVIIGALLFLSPNYLEPFFQTTVGNMVLLGCVLWMGLGIIIMRKMINLNI